VRLRPTGGDAFTITVLGQGYAERKEAGRALMKEILTLLQLQTRGEVHFATIGGFDLIYEGESIGKGDGYRYETLLQRTGADYEIDLAPTVTPSGAISEHALQGLDDEQRRYRRRLEEAERRLVSYRSRDGGAFAFADDLKEKRLKLRAIEAQLGTDLDSGTVAAAACTINVFPLVNSGIVP
jgi:hypothetical protein